MTARKKGRPGRKTKTDKEFNDRIEFVAHLVSRRMPKSAIKKACREQWQDPDLSSRTIETYISRARELIVKWTGQPKEEHKIEALSLYNAIIQSPTADWRDKIAAQTRIDQLLGTDAPTKSEVTTKDAVGPVTITFQVVNGNRALDLPAAASVLDE